MELSAAQESMMDMTPVERRAHGGGGGLGSGQRVTDGSVVRSLRRLCVEAVADHFGRHSRELLNLNPAARELLLAHLKARFNPARRHRRVGYASGLSEGAIDWFVLPDVRSLDLSRCATLSSRTLDAVSSRCFQLTSLDLSHATSLTDADLRPLFPPAFPFIASAAASSSSSASLLPLALPFSASSSPSTSTSGTLAFPLTASPSSSASSSGNSYSFASSSPAPAPQASLAQPSSPGFWNRLFSRSQQSPAASTSSSSSPLASPATSSSSLSSLPAAALPDDLSTPTMSLRAINLRNCSGLTSASVENILRLWSSSLQSLTLDGDRINPSSVAALAGASHLTRLALLHSPYLKPIPVSEMKLTDKAEESKYPVFEWQLMPALQGCLTPAMTELILHFDSETITEEVVCQIVGLCGSKLRLLEVPLPSPEAWKLVLRHCTSLRKLDLYGGNCTDEAVSGMANFPKATEVVVRGCSLSDESFIRIAGACPKITNVELRSVDTVTDVGMEAIANAVAVNLRDLTIASLEQVTDAALQHFSECCPNLRTLHLSGMSADDASQKLTGGTVVFPTLKELRLASLHCSDQTVAAILAHCTQLRTMHLDDVGGVTGHGIRSSSLWHLQLRSTPQLTDEGVESLAKQCPELRSVRVKHQATALRSLPCLLESPRLLELRIGEGNLLEDALFLPDGLRQQQHEHEVRPVAAHSTQPNNDQATLVQEATVAEVLEKAEAIKDMNREGEDDEENEDEERQREAGEKTSEDRRWGTSDELASKGNEDARHSLHQLDHQVKSEDESHLEDEKESVAGEGLAQEALESSVEAAAQQTTEVAVVAEDGGEAPSVAHECGTAVIEDHEDAGAAGCSGGECDEPMAICSLRDVKLKNCPLVTDSGVNALMRRCRCMTRLRLYYFPQVTGRTLGGASLRSLVLDQCGLTNEGFVSLIKASPRLRDIEISGAGGSVELTKLNDEGLRELDRHCPQLRSLSLSFLNNVGLTTASLTQLESLALEDMPAVTDESLGAFVGRCTKLCRLDVRAGAVRLDKKGPAGRRDSKALVVVTSMNVTASFVEALKTARPNLAVTYRLID